MTHVPDHAIAITGLAARLPGAPDVETFWQNLLGGRESITFFDRDELLRAGVPAAQLDDARYVRARGTIEGIDLFDAQFFGVTPREAEMMDPQHRLFLECAWHALENAGCDPSRFDGMIGVYASAGLNTYLINNVSRNPEVLEAAGSFQAFVGNDKDFLPMRVSYKLGLRGPSIGVQTACSSSLVAAALACQALLTYQCDAALVGAANVAVPQLSGYVHHEGGSFSPDGRCRPFDASAAGTVFSNGAGAIVLRRLADAIAGGDTIHAIITGFAVNNDGSAKIGFTAPSVEGQAEAVTLALELAGRHPEDLGYIEAHGTGTILGDPIEIAALTQVFRAYTARRGFCAIGSVKSNIGHLDVAAGLAGLIKATLAVERGVIPPSLHFERPNPRIDFASTPFFVNTAVRPWTGEPRRAGVTSLGLGGTNAHLVIEQAPPREIEPTRRRRHILPLSARGETPLADARKALAAALREGGIDLADAAFTLQIGRKAFELRQYVLAGDPSEAADALERRGGAPVRAASPRLALLFPGQEAQYAGLGRELANEEPLFREAFHDVATRFANALGFDPREAIEDASRLDDPAVAQPLLFAYEYAFARALAGYGVEPAAMIGHSLGEYVAATLAGVFTLDAAVRVVAARGQLMARCAPGRMLAVATGETTVRALLPHDLALASVNAPAQCVVSGPADAVFRFEALVRERGIDARPLATSHAFHSPMMTGAADALASAIGDARPAAPSVRFISSLTGTWITPEQATSARYWRDQLLGTVRFADGLSTLAADRALVLLDAGPRQTAARLARQTAGRTARIPLPPLRQWAADGERDRDYFLESLGALWCEGMDVDWSATYRAERRARVALPGYAFERKRYWVEPSQPPAAATTPRETSESRIEQNFFEIAWNESAPPAHGEQPRVVVVLEDEAGAGRAIADRLSGVEVIRESASSASFDRLIESLQPGRVAFVHCGALDGGASFEEAQNRGYHSVIALAKAIARRWSGHDSSLRVVTRGAWDVVASDRVDAAAATVFGPIKVLSQEYPNIAAQAIDVDAEAGAREIADAVAAELAAPPAVSLVAWRDGKRYERTPRRTSVPRERAPIRRGGHYFITGGLGQFGLILAEHLVTVRGARVTLLSRRPLPPRGEWAAIRRREARDAAAAAIHRLARLLDAGDGVLVVQGDVADRARLEAAVIAAEERFGAIHGVIHAAGVTGVEHFKTIAETGPADAALHFAAKAHGLLAIESVFAPRSPDFVMAVSSLSPILGGLGFSAYAAANIFMDAFVRARRKAGDDAYLTVNWEGWLPQHEEGHLLFGRQQIERMMSDDEIADVFERAVAARRVQVISATDDLVVREREWSTLGRAAIASSAASDDTTEAAMLRVWREVLGLDDLDADSNFYAVGGSSLSAMQIIARLRARLHIDLPLESFLTAQTPRALAALIDGRHAPEAAASLAPAAVEDILAEIEALDAEPPRRAASSDPSFGETPLDLSIIFFSGDATPSGNGGKYDLLLASAQLADTLGFSAVWLPERHFQKFGGLYPNPSVLGATVAAKTARIGIRAGSVVLPLHDPIRVAEEWSVVDNLSGGRVALSFAAGWHPNDFVFAPGSYADRRKAMFRDIDVVRRLWRGESVERALPDGSRAAVAILPRPLQAELPVWVTAESSETFVAAGEIGANILTGLINQTKDELAGRIALWRKALEEHGHDPGTRRVTLMLHTYVAHDARRVDERARPSLTRYLGEFLSQNTRMMAALAGVDPRSLTEADRATLVRLAVDRYIASNSLIGTPEHCLDVLEEVRRAGVGEIATLLDFGIAAEDVLSSLELLGEVAGQEKRSALMRP